MSVLLLSPLLPAALVAVCVALAARVAVPLALVLGGAGAIACAALALASADRPRQMLWACACASAVGVALRLVLGPIPGLDLAQLVSLGGLRADLAHPLRMLVPEPESGILLGIVLGERASVSPDLAYAFAVSGTTHLLAISGFNMTLVGAAVALALRGRARPPVRAVATVAAIVAYSLLVGLAPSVMRAALMASVASCGLASGRRAATANALCVAVTAMLFADPAAIADLGFLLSASATAGLVLWQAALAARFAALPGALREGLATTLAASAPTLPVVAAAFGRVSLVSPIANLVAVPLFPPLMLAGAAASAIGALSLDLARPVALVAYGCALALRTVVEAFAALPIAAVSVPSGPVTGAIVALALVAVVRGAPHLGGRLHLPRIPMPALVAPRAALLAVPALVVAGVLAWPTADPEVRVRALDVGQGDAYLVEIGGATVLIDGGPDPARLMDELGASLPPWRRRIDVVALTHAHLDHGAGLIAVLDRYEVGMTLEPVGLNAGPLADLWAAAITRAHAERRALRAGQRLHVADAVITVLSPEPDPRVDTPSLVLRVERGRFSALFMGDATDEALADLLLHPEGLRSRVYVPPHHGAATPHGVTLVESVRPELALLSVGAGNRYGHPTPETLAALGGITTFRTDRDGTVEVSLDGPGLVVRAHANGLPPPRRGSVPYAPARR
ncbi:MAG TPA: ComEC/Rec2 family competence protein [Candidatus Limnocylindria bacterium]|nr:ComEC/Rec2 family competence protein [Candidatus Limnocylindria bacterium]